MGETLLPFITLILLPKFTVPLPLTSMTEESAHSKEQMLLENSVCSFYANSCVVDTVYPTNQKK